MWTLGVEIVEGEEGVIEMLHILCPVAHQSHTQGVGQIPYGIDTKQAAIKMTNFGALTHSDGME